MAQIRLGSTRRPVYFGSSSVRVFEKATDTPSSVTITQTMGSGTYDEYTFSWTLSNVGSSGTFRDGTPWVVPAKGSSVLLTAASPSNQTQTVSGITFGDGQTGSLTIRHSGILINPLPGPQDTISSFAAGNYTTSGTWRCGDNRIGNNVLFASQAQSLCDENFDTSTFASRQAAMASGGLELSTNDVCVLTNSMFDATDLSYHGENSIGCTGTSGNGKTPWSSKTAIRWQAALFVLASAPSSPSTTFRPPVHWDTSLFGARPLFTESDMVDLSAIAHSDSVSAPFGLFSFGYTGSSLTASDFCVGPIIHEQSGLYYESQVALFNAALGLTSTYGQDLGVIMQNLLCRGAKQNSDNSTEMLKRYIQFGIDSYGAVSTRVKLSSGAGQKAGYVLPGALFMCKAFGLTDRYGVDELLGYFYGSSYASSTGDVSYASLTSDQKTTVKEQFFYEEYVCKTVAASGTGSDWAYDTTGSLYRFSIDPATDVSGYDTATRGALLQMVSGNSNAVSDPTYVMAIDMTNQAGDYKYRPNDNGDLATTNGFGVLELGTAVDFAIGGDVHADNYFNLYGCTVSIDGTEYYVVGCSQNIEEDTTDNIDPTTSPIYIILDRPLESNPELASSISVYPFRSSDVGKVYYSRENTRKESFGPFVINDGYGKGPHLGARATYTALRILDGNSTKLGQFGKLLEDHFWDTGSPHQWMFGNDAGDRNMTSWLMACAQSNGAWTRSITGQTLTTACRTLTGQQQQA